MRTQKSISDSNTVTVTITIRPPGSTVPGTNGNDVLHGTPGNGVICGLGDDVEIGETHPEAALADKETVENGMRAAFNDARRWLEEKLPLTDVLCGPRYVHRLPSTRPLHLDGTAVEDHADRAFGEAGSDRRNCHGT